MPAQVSLTSVYGDHKLELVVQSLNVNQLYFFIKKKIYIYIYTAFI